MKTSNVKETPTMESYQTPLPISEIESLARIKIPESAFDIRTHARWNGSIYIIFHLPPSKLDQFLVEAGFKHLEPGYWPFGDHPVPGWPKSSEFDNYPEETYAGGNLALVGFGKIIGVDMTNKDVFIIYLLCFRT